MVQGIKPLQIHVAGIDMAEYLLILQHLANLGSCADQEDMSSRMLLKWSLLISCMRAKDCKPEKKSANTTTFNQVKPDCSCR